MCMKDAISPDDLVDFINSRLPENQKIDKEKQKSVSASIASSPNIIDDMLRKNKESRLHNAAKLMKLSRQDILACRILHEKELYNLSVYHLQQAVEKGTKAYGLILSLDTDETFSVKHNSPAVYSKMLEKMWPMLDIIQQINPDLKGHYSDIIKITSDKTKKLEIAKLSPETIKQILLLIKNLNVTLGSDETKTDANKVIEGAKERFPQLSQELELAYYDSEFISHFLILFALSFITFPHEAYTRYSDNILFGPDNYTKDLGIVATSLELCDLLNDCLIFLDLTYFS